MTPNAAAALERLETKWRDEAGGEPGPMDYRDDAERALLRCADELATIRASLAQQQGEAVAVVDQTAPEGLHAHFTRSGLYFTVPPGTQLFTHPVQGEAVAQPQDHNDNGDGRDNKRQPQGTTPGSSPGYSRPPHHTDRHDGQPSPSATRDDMTAGGTSASDGELPGMWSRSDFTGGATDAEHRQARELRTIVAGIDASESMPPTPHPDCNALVKLVDTNDWAIIRAALLRQREVTDAMMERAIKGWLAHQNKCRITTADGCLRAALTAALLPATSDGEKA